MHFVERIQVQSTRQRKIPVPKKFWREFPLDSFVKIELLNDQTLFFVERVQAQGGLQRRIPLPQKFWAFFPANSVVKVELMHKPTVLKQILTTVEKSIDKRVGA